MSNPLLAPTFLFRFAFPCGHRPVIWQPDGIALEPRFQVPRFGELDGRPSFADVRCAWSPAGLTFNVLVKGKQQSLWCRASRWEDSDGLRVWVDTRDTHNIHRASRYCHQFVFLPGGDDGNTGRPVAKWVAIHRAKDHPQGVDPTRLAVASRLTGDGYSLQAHVPAVALCGFDPVEHPRIGIFYAVTDRELGWQTLTVGPEFPFAEDPSMWGTLELVAAASSATDGR